MKRFIDLREAHIGERFAWYDTVKDCFETHAGRQAWETWSDFAECYSGDDLRRYADLAPSWTTIDPRPDKDS